MQQSDLSLNNGCSVNLRNLRNNKNNQRGAIIRNNKFSGSYNNHGVFFENSSAFLGDCEISNNGIDGVHVRGPWDAKSEPAWCEPSPSICTGTGGGERLGVAIENCVIKKNRENGVCIEEFDGSTEIEKTNISENRTGVLACGMSASIFISSESANDSRAFASAKAG